MALALTRLVTAHALAIAGTCMRAEPATADPTWTGAEHNVALPGPARPDPSTLPETGPDLFSEAEQGHFWLASKDWAAPRSRARTAPSRWHRRRSDGGAPRLAGRPCTPRGSADTGSAEPRSPEAPAGGQRAEGHAAAVDGRRARSDPEYRQPVALLPRSPDSDRA
jgi:hypothetical protein